LIGSAVFIKKKRTMFKQWILQKIKKRKMPYKVNKSAEEWKEKLSSEQYRVLREHGTERPFTGELYENKEEGVYSCGACGFDLFSSEHKYNTGCGWPSYWGELDSATIERKVDLTHGMVRTELLCSNCGSHLGHAFNDGPRDKGGERYCINSISMIFRPNAD
jgi:peptide-methionine (R)-S-oxide reductase